MFGGADAQGFDKCSLSGEKKHATNGYLKYVISMQNLERLY